ncbi:MAG: hypothetical protein ACREMA_05510, partial [Longimicrobiales bacterium]
RRFAAAVDGGEAVRLRCARRVRETAAWCGPAGARRRGLVHGHEGETAGGAVEWRVESGCWEYGELTVHRAYFVGVV